MGNILIIEVLTVQQMFYTPLHVAGTLIGKIMSISHSGSTFSLGYFEVFFYHFN